MIHQRKLNNNVTIEYLDQGEGEVILLLHGLGSTKADWDLQIETLTTNFRVIAPDFRGHGNSSKPLLKEEYGVKLCAEDMMLLLDEISVTRCSVIGFSMGGAVAFEMAVRYPSLFKKMVIVNTAPDFNNLGAFGDQMIQERTQLLRTKGMEAMAKKVSEGMFPDKGQEQLQQAFFDRASKNQLEPYFNSFTSLMNWGLGAKIEQIAIPSLVIASEFDYTPIASKENYVAKMQNSKLHVIKASRHGVTMDQPDEFNRVILKFLKSE